MSFDCASLAQRPHLKQRHRLQTLAIVTCGFQLVFIAIMIYVYFINNTNCCKYLAIAYLQSCRKPTSRVVCLARCSHI